MIAYLTGSVLTVSRGRFVIIAQSGIGYEVRYGQTLMPCVGQDLVCHVVHTFPQSGDQVLYGYGSAKERDIADVITDVKGLGPGKAHKIVTTLGTEALLNAASGRSATLGKVAGVGKPQIEEAIAMLAKKLKTGLDTSIQPAWARVASALEAMGLEPEKYGKHIVDVLNPDVPDPDTTTSHLVQLVLRKANS